MLALASACSVDGHLERPEWSLERMLEQPRADAFEPNPFFPGRSVLRASPPGVVPSTDELAPSEVVSGMSDDGSYVATIPIPTSRAVLDEGRERFQVICAACHGVAGDGRSAVAAYMELRKPVSFHDARHRAMPPGQVFAIVTHGVGLMPSYSVELDVRQRWAVVAYVKALELSRHAVVAELPPDVRRDVEREIGR